MALVKTIVLDKVHTQDSILNLRLIKNTTVVIEESDMDILLEELIIRTFSDEYDEYEEHIVTILKTFGYTSNLAYELFGELVNVVSLLVNNAINVIGYDEQTHEFLNVIIENNILTISFRYSG